MLKKLINLFKRPAAAPVAVLSESTKKAASMVEDMRALEWLDDVGYFEDFDDLDAEQLEEITPEELKAARYLHEDLKDRHDEAGSYSAAYFLDVLDIENHYKGSAGDKPYLYQVSALTCFGGPNIWIDSKDGENLEIRVYWWGDNVGANLYAPNVAGALWSAGEIFDYIEAIA